MPDIPQQSLIEDAPDWLKPSAMQSEVIDDSFPTMLLVVFLIKLSKNCSIYSYKLNVVFIYLVLESLHK